MNKIKIFADILLAIVVRLTAVVALVGALYVVCRPAPANGLKIQCRGVTSVVQWPHADSYQAGDLIVLREQGKWLQAVVLEAVKIDPTEDTTLIAEPEVEKPEPAQPALTSIQ